MKFLLFVVDALRGGCLRWGWWLLVQGGNVKVLKGDNTTTADPSDHLAVSRAYPHTFGQPLVQFSGSEEKTAKHSPVRYLRKPRDHDHLRSRAPDMHLY